MNKTKGKILGVCICGVFVFSLYYYCQKSPAGMSQPITATSVFSWEAEYMEPEQAAVVDRAMEKLKCQAIYQEVPANTDNKVVSSFLQRMSRKSKDVYYLSGASEWGLSPGKEIMLKETEEVIRLNRRIRNGGFTGIVWDVEPYLLDEWEENRDIIMETYVDNSIAAYNLANEKNLRVIVCIPNFYDRIGHEAQLERLIAFGCDAIAVMNYNKSDESGQIATEAMLAEKYGKGIINITELQKPGYHELTEENTYYYDGISGVEESWKRLRGSLSYQNLGFSWHYLKPILSLLEEDGQ